MFHSNECTDFRRPETPHDRVIVVEDVKFYVHYGLLESWSGFFRTKNHSCFKESEQEHIVINELAANEFEDFLHLISPDKFEITESNYIALIRLSFRFLAPGVLRQCEKFIEANYEHMEKIKLLDIASEHSLNVSQDFADSIFNSITSLDPLKLLRVAFRHNLESIKAALSDIISSESRTGTLDHCINEDCNTMMYTGHPCPCGAGHQKREQFLLFPRRSFLFQDRDRILSLPSKIQKFILYSMIFTVDSCNIPEIIDTPNSIEAEAN